MIHFRPLSPIPGAMNSTQGWLHVLSLWVLAAVAAIALCASPRASAQTASMAVPAWPTKPVKLIVNYPPGSSPDVIARALSIPLQQALGQSVVLENRAGANGMIGGEAAARAPADGYTLLMTAGSTIAINPHLYASMAFDPNKDLVPVAATARITLFLLARPSLPVDNITEFLAYLKANPDKLSYGSAGNGSGLHIAGEMLKSQAGLSAVHVPYRGAAPALQDLLAGQIDFYFDPGIGLTHVRAGKLKLLGVGRIGRSSQFPDAPTLDEAGLKGFDVGTTHALYAPAGTPADVVGRLNREINRILGTSEVRAVIASIAAEPTPMSPAELEAIMRADSNRYGAIIKERSIRAD